MDYILNVIKADEYQQTVKNPLPDDFLRVPGSSSNISSNSILGLSIEKLDIPAAEKRIPKLPSRFKYLTKASLLYQHGTLNSLELEKLRELVLSQVEDTTFSLWPLLILKCKEIRPAILTRITIADGQVNFRVTDLASGIFFQLVKKHKQVVKFYKKVGHNKEPLGSSSSVGGSAHQRTFNSLCTLASAPMTFINGCILKEMQLFLGFHDRLRCFDTLELPPKRRRKQHIKVTCFRLLTNKESAVGQAMRRFHEKMREQGMSEGILEELQEFITHVHSYVLEHHAAAELMVEEEEEERGLVSDCLRWVIEELVLVPIHVELKTFLKHSCRRKESRLQQTIRALRGKPQTFFDIPIEKNSLSSWEKSHKGSEEYGYGAFAV